MRILRYLFLTATLALLLIIPFRSSTAATISLVINNPVCVQPDPASSACYIKTLSAVATGSESSFSQLNVLVDNKLRLSMMGFFEANAYLYSDMLGNGLAVACGRPNASGNPDYGKSYILKITASMSDGANTWGSAVVRCPYYDGKIYLPNIIR
jgi:hypothetical protein